MPSHLKVEITPVMVGADEHTLTRRAAVAQRLDNLGHIDASTGEINTETTAGWQATINGTTVPIDGYAAEPDGNRVLLSLVLPVDALSIGCPPTTAPAPAEEKPKRSVWGDPGTRDPRESIPGWRESIAQQVATNAEAAQR